MGTVLIPIRPEIYEFDDNGYRKQFPISLSWELTAWQAQGLTCRTNVFVVIGQHEKATGLTSHIYVACSQLHWKSNDITRTAYRRNFEMEIFTESYP